jgi:hypothetical protein
LENDKDGIIAAQFEKYPQNFEIESSIFGIDYKSKMLKFWEKQSVEIDTL